MRLGHLSDLHVRTGVRPARVWKAIELLNAAKPDLVLLTGDYVCFSPKPLWRLTEALAEIEAPAFATLGNHDHWSDAQKVREALDAAGVTVLTNAHRAVEIRGGVLHLVGVDDSITDHHDPERAFAGLPANATEVVLSHDPNSADFLGRHNPALILSGHTHGGQIYFRRLTPRLAARTGVKYLSGLFDVDGATLFVNRGLGATVPVRFRAPPEVALLTLRSTLHAERPIPKAS